MELQKEIQEKNLAILILQSVYKPHCCGKLTHWLTRDTGVSRHNGGPISGGPQYDSFVMVRGVLGGGGSQLGLLRNARVSDSCTSDRSRFFSDYKIHL